MLWPQDWLQGRNQALFVSSSGEILVRSDARMSKSAVAPTKLPELRESSKGLCLCKVSYMENLGL